MTVKQIIVMREDLNMSRGKLASQAAHASMGSLLAHMRKQWDEDGEELFGYDLTFGPHNAELKEWLENSFTKIVVYVKSEEKLMNLYNKVKEAGLRVTLIEDNGTTEFGGVKTKTAIAIGPHASERLDPFTKKYPLLK